MTGWSRLAVPEREERQDHYMYYRYKLRGLIHLRNIVGLVRVRSIMRLLKLYRPLLSKCDSSSSLWNIVKFYDHE